ncbi:MAG: glycerol-3-phosphate dehydrogenase, partial [Rhizobiaceae bacterium]
VKPRTAVENARHESGKWHLALTDTNGGTENNVTASMVINAAGPYVDDVLKNVFGRNDAHHVRLVRGSHIVIRKKFQHDRCYIFQNSDERIIFAIPYERDYTLIGTTDVEHGEMDGPPEITDEETDYLCKMASEYFIEEVIRKDIVWTYSGVRPLYDDGASKAQEATRDYVIKKDEALGDGSLLNIFGGKITTFRRLAESVMEEVEEILGNRGPAWTSGATLPGGDFPVTGYQDLVEEYANRFPFLEHGLVARLVRHYGTDTGVMLDGIKSLKDMGIDFGAGLFEAEVRYLIAHEWAIEPEDILFRRTRLGISMTGQQINALRDYMKKPARRNRKRAV